MKRNLLSIVLTVSLAAMVLTGCGSKEEKIPVAEEVKTVATEVKKADEEPEAVEEEEEDESVEETAEESDESEEDLFDPYAIDYIQNVPLKIGNNLGDEIAQIYVVMSRDKDWGPDLLAGANGYMIADGEVASGLTLTYGEGDSLIDIRVVTASGDDIEFNEIDVIESKTDTIVLSLNYDTDAQEYYCSLESVKDN